MTTKRPHVLFLPPHNSLQKAMTRKLIYLDVDIGWRGERNPLRICTHKPVPMF